MKISAFAAALMAFSAPALAQTSGDHAQHHPEGAVTQQAQPGSQMPMGQMMQTMPQARMDMMHSRMMGGSDRGGMMGRFSAEDMSAFADAHIAALRAGLRLSAEQEKLWPPVEETLRSLARLHMAHMQVMRQNRGMMRMDPVGTLRAMADHMGQGSEAMRKLADAAAPLYATLDEAQKRRLHVLIRSMPRAMMGRGMMDPGRRAMMRDWDDDDDDDQDNR
ncbi:Spy/CpxP family protein refolding chaperone [Microvirga sp. KLBC 81]|uniref:Spy/CpxP family protein refolding chaperone n=1 Tax=Microvirga sp. KLBC 81 TaxID=1862707 RepID=UPI001403A1AD|nr:Spy/CpxP family protein refolding chaperone [Microvirga sp. KLBC 81]